MLMSQGTLTKFLEITSSLCVRDVNGKGTMQEDARLMSLVRQHERGGKECRKLN